MQWINKYEWRTLTDMEICGISTLWKSVGDAMDIQYAGYLSKSQWKDGLEFYQDISAWAEKYEQQYMVPALANKKLAEELLPLLLFYVPKSALGAANNIIGYLMGERLCKAMMYVSSQAVVLANEKVSASPPLPTPVSRPPSSQPVG